MKNENKMYSYEDVQNIVEAAINFVDSNFDKYMERSDYLPTEMRQYLNVYISHLK